MRMYKNKLVCKWQSVSCESDAITGERQACENWPVVFSKYAQDESHNSSASVWAVYSGSQFINYLLCWQYKNIEKTNRKATNKKPKPNQKTNKPLHPPPKKKYIYIQQSQTAVEDNF